MLYTHDELHDELQRHTPTTYSAGAAAAAAAAAASSVNVSCFVGSLSLCCTTLCFFSGPLLGDVASSSRGRVVAPPVEPSGADAAGAAAAAASPAASPGVTGASAGAGAGANSAPASAPGSAPPVESCISSVSVSRRRLRLFLRLLRRLFRCRCCRRLRRRDEVPAAGAPRLLLLLLVGLRLITKDHGARGLDVGSASNWCSGSRTAKKDP